MLLTILMILDALIAIGLIASVLMQEGKTAGMGGLSGQNETAFSSSARGMDALMARFTVFFAVLFMIVTIVIAKITNERMVLYLLIWVESFFLTMVKLFDFLVNN